MKKILLVTTVSETINGILAGQPRYLRGTFNVYLACSDKSFFPKIEKKEGIFPSYIPMLRGISPFFDLYSLFKMIVLILRIRPDVVHSYTPKAGMIAMVASMICRVPIRIHTFTGLIFPTASGLRQKTLMLADRLICLCATRVVPEGNGVKNDLINFKITNKTLQLIGNGNIAGIDVNFFNPDDIAINKEAFNIRSKLGVSQNAFLICFIGRLNYDKGIKELLMAFNSIENEKKHLIIVGPLDQAAPISDAEVNEINTNKKISWMGYLQDVRPILALSDVLVLPSYREGFPNVLLEAGAMGRVCISTNVSGANEIIDDGITGFIVPIKDDRSLKAKLLHVMKIPTLELEVMGKAARKKICELFERKSYLNKLTDFYLNEIRNKL